jgi:hypothetical protein
MQRIYEDVNARKALLYREDIMNSVVLGNASPEICANKIFEISGGTKLDPDIAADRWQKILQHKWLMSEKLGRDVGFRTACIDFLENVDQALSEYMDYYYSEDWSRQTKWKSVI